MHAVPKKRTEGITIYILMVMNLLGVAHMLSKFLILFQRILMTLEDYY